MPVIFVATILGRSCHNFARIRRRPTLVSASSQGHLKGIPFCSGLVDIFDSCIEKSSATMDFFSTRKLNALHLSQLVFFAITPKTSSLLRALEKPNQQSEGALDKSNQMLACKRYFPFGGLRRTVESRNFALRRPSRWLMVE